MQKVKTLVFAGGGIHDAKGCGESIADTLIVHNIGTGMLTWSADNDSEWLELDSEYNVIAESSSDSLFLLVNAADLIPDDYIDTIFITSWIQGEQKSCQVFFFRPKVTYISI